MNIEILYVEGCPHHDRTLELVSQVARDLRVDAQIRFREVKTSEEAERLRFLGSPTVQIDGRDIDPQVRTRVDYGISCRIYGTSGIPSRELIETALREGRPL